jgi:imidazolonepropionase-like amidohydrolase
LIRGKKDMKIITVKRDQELLLIPDAFIDVTDGEVLKNKALLISKGRIRKIISSDAAYRLAEREKIKYLYLSGITFMPGLIDCHVHFALDGVDFHQALGRWDNEVLLNEHVAKAAANFLSCGVTTVRDGGDKECIGLKVRNSIKDGSFPGPLVNASGYVLRKDGYYGTFLGAGIKSIDEGKEQIKELSHLGVDQIKIAVSGIVSFKELGKVGPVQFTQEELTALVQESHDQGLKVMAHASSDQAVRISALAGVDSIEHGFFVSTSTLELMAEKKIAWVPTVAPMALLTEEPQRKLRAPEEIEILEKTYRPHLDMIKKAETMGILLGIGTDAGAIGVEHGVSYYHEVRLFHQAGLSNLSCLQAATCQAAKIIGREGELGEITLGKVPRLTGFMGNPLNNLTVLRNPACIVLPEFN